MLRIRSGLASCDRHDSFKNTREHAGFKTGNEPCFAFGAAWQAAISMISLKTLGKMQVSKQVGEVWQAAISMISSNTLGKMKVSKQETSNEGFKTENEPCSAFGAVWQAAISMISLNTVGKIQVSNQETSHASHSERFGKLRSARFLQKH